MLQRQFDAIFGGVGNIQKFPSRARHEQHLPHRQQPGARRRRIRIPEYVAAIERVNTTLGPGPDVKAAYDNLNKVLVESAFGIPTNTYDSGLIVAAKNVGGFTLDIDNMLVARTTGSSREQPADRTGVAMSGPVLSVVAGRDRSGVRAPVPAVRGIDFDVYANEVSRHRRRVRLAARASRRWPSPACSRPTRDVEGSVPPRRHRGHRRRSPRPCAACAARTSASSSRTRRPR